MTKRDKVGILVLAALFMAFGLLLFLTVRPQSGARRSYDDNIFVRQRMINLQKSE